MCDEDEVLLRYHFGDLDPSEREAVERRLRDEPEFATRLAQLEECLAAQDGGPEEDPVKSAAADSLADKTIDTILATPDGARGCVGSYVGRKRFSLGEVVAVGVAAGLVGMLVLPAVQASRAASHRAQCAKNLGDLGQSLMLYAEDHGGALPRIDPGMNAGMFTVSLADGRYREQPDLEQNLLLCPSSELATQVAMDRAKVRVPTTVELRTASPLLLEKLRRWMAGSYAYRLGYFKDGRYFYPKWSGSSREAVLADAPTRDENGGVVSRNHGACGQNVLYQDGSVAFLATCWSLCEEDHLYLNDAGEVAAGRGPRDVVLAPSEATPGVVRVLRLGF